MDLPISSLLKRRSELETAKLEDDAVSAIFSSTTKVALHGGTTVWRCYNGKRFSKDIDVYLWDEDFKDIFINAMEKVGITVPKYREKGITFIHVQKGNTEIKIEPNNTEKASILVPYERVDGTKINVQALAPEGIILEKISAYNDRLAYKDLYDITILLNSVTKPEAVKQKLRAFAKGIGEPDKEFQSYAEFRTLIYAGVAPTFEKMVDFIARWSR